jgi:hypothetical protein
MIELPETPAPNGVEVALLDYGMILRPATGAEVLRINRAGTRHRLAISFPPMRPDTARKFIARFQKAKREGLRIDFPLLGLSQGVPGTPVVDGAGQAGTTLALRGLTPGYAVKEGFWLTLIDDSGRRYLHTSSTAVVAGGDGKATIGIEPPLRAPFADGATVLLGKPTVEGVLVDELGWSLSVGRLIRGGTIMLEEAA